MERGPSELTLQQQAALLSGSRSSLYYQPVPPSVEEIAIKHRLDELYTDFPSYGSRKLAVLLAYNEALIACDGLRVGWWKTTADVQIPLREGDFDALLPELGKNDGSQFTGNR